MNFSRQLIEWQRLNGRNNLPWQSSRDPYRIWVSEIMLQQTQVATVIPYYERFMTRFPTTFELAQASEEEVLTYWAGLGYYARGRNLHRAAREILEKHAGIFPKDYDLIVSLPGIGRSTASAISAFAYGERRAILDGNVKRVLSRTFAVDGWAGDKKVENRLWELSERLLPERDIEIYTQALMDLGATVCTRSKPKCGLCPLVADCVAYQEGRVASLPSPRPRKALPERAATLLVIRHGRDVLLKKRPATGIWGGLWSLPEAVGDTGQTCLQLTGQLPANMEELPAFKHTFTHFRLSIQPIAITLNTLSAVASEPGSIWMEINEALGAAIPKPVKSILQGFAEC